MFKPNTVYRLRPDWVEFFKPKCHNPANRIYPYALTEWEAEGAVTECSIYGKDGFQHPVFQHTIPISLDSITGEVDLATLPPGTPLAILAAEEDD